MISAQTIIVDFRGRRDFEFSVGLMSALVCD